MYSEIMFEGHRSDMTGYLLKHEIEINNSVALFE